MTLLPINGVGSNGVGSVLKTWLPGNDRLQPVGADPSTSAFAKASADTSLGMTLQVADSG